MFKTKRKPPTAASTWHLVRINAEIFNQCRAAHFPWMPLAIFYSSLVIQKLFIMVDLAAISVLD
jgi:hypothetical protein